MDTFLVVESAQAIFEGRTTGQDGRAGGGLNDEASTGCRLGLTQDAEVAQVVVTAVQCQVALVDAVHADILASHAAQAATGGVAVLQAADLVGQARVGIAVDLGLGVGDHISGNYDLSYQGNNLTITKALLNVIADAKTKVYTPGPAILAGRSPFKTHAVRRLG